MKAMYVASRVAALDSIEDVGIVAINSPDGLSDALWEEYLRLQKKFVADFGAPKYVINITPFHGPNAKQRKRMEDDRAALGIDNIRYTAVVSDSAIVRGSLTALSWILSSVKMKVFAPRELEAAVRWVSSQGAKPPVELLLNEVHALMDGVGLKLKAPLAS